MSMTHAQKAILQAAQKKQNCNLVQERKYDDYGDYGDVHGDYYDFDCGVAQPEARSAAKTDSGQECKYDDYGDYGDVHGDYYDFDCGVAQPEARSAAKTDSGQECKYDDYGDYGDVHGDYYDCVYEPVEMVVEKPDILQGIKNRLFHNTK